MTHAVRYAVVVLLVAAMSSVAGAQRERPRDEWLSQPVDDATLDGFSSGFVYDHELPLEVEVLDRHEEDGVVREHLSFQSTPGERVTAFYVESTTADSRPRPGLVLLHGGGAEGKDGQARTATRFARDGIATLAIDMKHFGERNTSLLTTFTEAEKHENLYNAPDVYMRWVEQTVKDAGRAFDLLVDSGVDARRIGLYGSSRGAVAATIASAVDERFAAVVLHYGGHFDGLEREHLAAACPANYIGRISPRPLLMLNGTFDADFDQAASVNPMFDLARDPKTILWTEGGHGRASESNLDAMHAWVRRALE